MTNTTRTVTWCLVLLVVAGLCGWMAQIGTERSARYFEDQDAREGYHWALCSITNVTMHNECTSVYVSSLDTPNIVTTTLLQQRWPVEHNYTVCNATFPHTEGERVSCYTTRLFRSAFMNEGDRNRDSAFGTMQIVGALLAIIFAMVAIGLMISLCWRPGKPDQFDVMHTMV